ncbi:MAG: carbamoyltransferase HypF, partial [Gammaproteobacteria bacterium]
LECPATPPGSELAAQAWRSGINAPYTSAVGRLFDAASALTGITINASFEGQGPMLLEAAADGCYDGLDLPLSRNEQGVWITDWAPLLPMLIDISQPLARRAAIFHDSMARAALSQALRIRGDAGLNRIGLGGGVFQNRLLNEHLLSLLTAQGFEVETDTVLPVNDGGLCAGQILEYAARQAGINNTRSD